MTEAALGMNRYTPICHGLSPIHLGTRYVLIQSRRIDPEVTHFLREKYDQYAFISYRIKNVAA